jgi:tetratricopeptide (TPR) repeat protein/O-antigen ligase
LDKQSPRWDAYAIVALTMLAPVLGGGTEFWAQAIVALGTGLLFFLAPPRRTLSLLPNLLFSAIALAALTAFLPAHWFSVPDWRSAVSQFGIQLPDTRSPQPWLTFQASWLLWLGLAWAYYLLAFEWPGVLREKAWNIFCFAILGLAATLAFAFAINKHVPFWPDVREFGFFPNRNQTSNVLALGGIMIYANAFQHLQRGRNTGWIWLASVALICWALILNYSRSGIILFFGGALIWNLWWWWSAKERAGRAIAFAPLALLLALLVVAGGETFLRFIRESADLLAPGHSARISIFRDALQLMQQSPLLGTGLGNFRSLFSSHRNFSFNTSESIHPESDWIWVAVEMGCLVPLMLLALFGWWIYRSFPFASGTWRQMRMAALICGCGFVVHGFFDVSGHRIGALWPALFLASTAIHPQDRPFFSRAIAIIFRSLGVLFVAVGMWWLASIAGARFLPTTASLKRLMSDGETAGLSGDYPAMLRFTSEALKIAPLNWELYFKRGFAEAGSFHASSEVERDFAVARYLLPNWPELYLKEGALFLAVGEPDLAFNVWQEGMQRIPREAPHLYAQIPGLIKSDVALLDRWRHLGQTNKECLLIFLQNAGPFEFQIELQRLLSEDPQLRSFSPTELRTLFSAWYQKGDKSWLAKTLREHPDWQTIAWREWARAYGDNQDYRQACEIVQEFGVPPEIPKMNTEESLDKVAARFRVNRTDIDDGLALYFAQTREGQIDAALRTVRELEALPDGPKYLYYLEAQLWAQKGEWKDAWQALERVELGNK